MGVWVRGRKGFRLMLVSSLGVWAGGEHRHEGAYGGQMWLGHAEFHVPVYRALMWTHSINGSSMVLECGREICVTYRRAYKKLWERIRLFLRGETGQGYALGECPQHQQTRRDCALPVQGAESMQR